MFEHHDDQASIKKNWGIASNELGDLLRIGVTRRTFVIPKAYWPSFTAGKLEAKLTCTTSMSLAFPSRRSCLTPGVPSDILGRCPLTHAVSV